MEYSLADLARITGAKPRAIQLWADAGVIRALPRTERGGSGTHRRFSRLEAKIACLVAAIARRKVAIGVLMREAEILRRMHPDTYEDVIAENKNAYYIFGWDEGDHPPLLIQLSTGGHIKLSEIMEPSKINPKPVATAVVIAIHIALARLGPK